jgi:hypothetical protein
MKESTTHYTTKKQVQMVKCTITLPTTCFDFVSQKATQKNITKSGYIESLINKDKNETVNKLLS